MQLLYRRSQRRARNPETSSKPPFEPAYLDVRDAGRAAVLRDAHRVAPVLLVHVHVDRFFWFLRFDELLLRLLEVALVLQPHGVFQVHLRGVPGF